MIERKGFALFACALILSVAPETARAHASLVSSSPAAGSTILAPPREFRLVFSEPVVGALSQVTVIGADGKATRLTITSDPQNVRAIVGRSDSLATGAYQVKWRIVSADGHPVSGEFVFTLARAGVPSPPIPTTAHPGGQVALPSPPDTAAEVAGAALLPAVLRGLGLASLLAVCGLLGFAGYSTSDNRQHRLCVWLSAAATLFLAAHLAAWLAHVSPSGTLDAAVAREALSREVGLNELIRLVLTALTAWAVILARRLRIAFAFALAAVIAGGAIGHPAAIDSLVAIPSKSLHLVGVAFWMGGLLWILTANPASSDTVSGIETFSNVALISAGTVAITGIIQGILFLPDWADLTGSAYGLALLGKTAGLAALLGFGAYHRYSILPGLAAGKGDERLRPSLKREVGVMILVIMLGAFLAYVPVPEQGPPHRASTSASNSG